MTDEEAMKQGLKIFNDAIQSCDSEADASTLCQALITLSAKLVAGVDGHKFKKGFLSSAIKDREVISLDRASKPH